MSTEIEREIERHQVSNQHLEAEELGIASPSSKIGKLHNPISYSVVGHSMTKCDMLVLERNAFKDCGDLVLEYASPDPHMEPDPAKVDPPLTPTRGRPTPLTPTDPPPPSMHP